MDARGLAMARLVRATLVPLMIAFVPLFWVVDAAQRALSTTLGRDQGIFQYVAWAVRRGAVDYRDVRDVNGPLTHFVHLGFMALGGGDERRFHALDLAVTGATFALVGACVAGWTARKAPSWGERGAWALAGWVVLSGQYLLYSWWDAAQRESFCDWFMLPSVALQLAAQRPGARHARPVLAIAGALSIAPWFGKPTYALFTIAQAGILLAEPGPHLPRRRALLAFASGSALAAATLLGLVAWCGDLRAYLRIQLVDVPAVYRFIWPRAAADIFSTPFHATHATFALAGGAVFLALVLLREMPLRALLVALVPLSGLASVVAQAKGFPYHFHPVTAGVYLEWLVFASWVAGRARVARRRWAAVRLLPVGVAVVLSLQVASAVQDSPYVRDVWLLSAPRTADGRAAAGRAYYDHFARIDYFPYEMRQAADYLRANTQATDRVQTYGMDAYVLFLAERMSATPYIYAYDLNADAALYGGTATRPNDAETARIRAIRDGHEADLFARLRANPPAAFVFMDGSPLMSESDAWDDFEEHCPSSSEWVRANYRERARFGHEHVWLRETSAP